jgi:DNA-directed RNA polymerase specialized sigma24 family protein
MPSSETDIELLQEYAKTRADDLFTALVERHIDLVFSAAVRQVRSQELAQEVTQAVFIELNRQASKLRSDTVLPAWLY